ncbi:MAG: type I DNA topoisomerase [Candidatus Eisenbacteria bacterium]
MKAPKAAKAARAAGPKAARAARSAKPKTARTRSAAADAEGDGDGSRASGKTLVVVESPAKSRTLNKFLGRDYMVLASNGHVMDLPKSQLGVDIDNDFEPVYVPIRDKNQALGRIQAAARHAERILLAPDPDREGEAIAWHLAEAIRSSKRPVQRLTFNEITQRAVSEALANPRDIDMNLVNAQQARRVLDRLVGYKVSPFVWSTIKYGLSAGRVQSVALRLICEREDQIRAFVAEEYWTLEVDYQTAGGERFTARLVRVGEEELEQGQLRGENPQVRAEALAAELATAAARIANVEVKPRLEHPKPPFITSTLQQTASNRYGFTSQRTMQIAQKLYEGIDLGPQGSVGLITYMRTDSPRLAGEAIGEIRGWLTEHLGEDYVHETPRQFRGKKSAQDAHEAIRPTSAARTPDLVKRFLTEEQYRLYDLIWKRALASQASPAQYDATTVDVEAGRLGLRATGRVLKFAGFQKLYGFDEEDDASESRLPVLRKEETLSVASAPLGEHELPLRPEQHFTKPPARYTDASLVKALEEENIGRPSTYATIVTTITKRDYVEREGRSLKPTDLGMVVTRLLVETFPDVFNVEFTSGMEEQLDEVEEGKQEWQQVVRALWTPLSKDLENAKGKVKQLKDKLQEKTDIDCPNCGRKLVKKFGRNGPFLACPGYPDCKHTQPLDASELPVPVEGVCPKCGSGLVARNGPYGRFIHCSTRPTCDFTKPFTLGVTCPECGQGEIAEKRSRKGKMFFSCTRYPDCTYAMWDRPRPTPCPNCKAPFLVEKVSKAGTRLQCLSCKAKFPMEAGGA